LLNYAAPGLGKVLDIDASALSADQAGELAKKRAFHDVFRSVFPRLCHALLFKTKDIFKQLDGYSETAFWEQNDDHRKGVVVIFLDDLDRCPQDRVIEVLEAINLFMDLPSVCFVLGIDWQRLLKILEKRFAERSEEFLEKIVQISLELPAINEHNVGEFVTGLVGQHLLLQLHLGERCADLAGIFKGARRHPRHIKRFLNDLSMRLAIMRNAEKLGDATPDVTEKAVIAWNVLHESLPEFAIDAAKSRENLDGFLRRWQSLNTQSDEIEGKESDKQLISVHGDVNHFIQELVALDTAQRETLVHLASPPEEDNDLVQLVDRISTEGIGGLAWCQIKRGTFQMGSDDGGKNEKPVHLVTISNDFQISRFPITNSQYYQFLEETEWSRKPPKHWDQKLIPSGLEQHPVVHVSHADATAYCDWLTEKEKLLESKRVRLPTEAEWEYVAAGVGGITRRYPWGDEEPDKNRANFKTSATTPVDAFPDGATPMPEGVMDMAGHVWEWCLDGYSEIFYEDCIKAGNKPDPFSLMSSLAVLRGGSVDYSGYFLRCAVRNWFPSVSRLYYLGCRVVLSPFTPSES
jgi:iron(II)-dependent oxidoreductase